LVQDRPEIERDYDAMTAMIADTYTPFYNEMLEGAAAVYAANFTTDEMRQMEAFYRMTLRSLRLLDCSTRMIFCALSMCLTFSLTTSPARRPQP
jgi:hypothetical protein